MMIYMSMAYLPTFPTFRGSPDAYCNFPEVSMPEQAELALQYLLLRLKPLNRALRAAVRRQTQRANRLLRPDVTPLCVTEDQVSTLLNDMDASIDAEFIDNRPASLNSEELVEQAELRSQAATLSFRLPLDHLYEFSELSNFEQESILLCAAPELHRSYERIYAYILDDLNRRVPCIELLCSLTAGSLQEATARRQSLGRFGKLRRRGILMAYGEPTSELRQELRLAPGVFDFLTGNSNGGISSFTDPAEVLLTSQIALPSGAEKHELDRLAHGLRQGWLSTVGIWDARRSEIEELPIALASLVGKPLRICKLAGKAPTEIIASLKESLLAASILNSILWLDTDVFTEPGAEYLSSTAANIVAATNVEIIFSGTRPWRPTCIIEARDYAEIEIEPPELTHRQKLWSETVPDAAPEQLKDLAARYRINRAHIRAAARMGRTRARLAGNGHAAALHDHLELACATVSRKTSLRFATVVKPKRGPNDLILSRAIHEQVLEVAHFFRAWPKVGDEWGFGRLETGAGGVKALFTGDSGTGKTLAAEVIAGQLKMPLLKIDLAQVVSKWIGETEKHLEGAFREAEDSHAVLFFDEADALFGKRGEVQHGVDRYANLEVSYLLQRLEEYSGLIILASNLKNNIDAAFTRRFHTIIHFPRPDVAERRQIWQIAFPPSAPLEDRNDLEGLAKLDLTGAGIVGAARTAALLAACEGSALISKPHIVSAIQRQYRREARVIMPAELGAYTE
jgi:hypothetical protein